jgi:hypothetical protein
MTARLGRASYVGGESLPPDPGAVGLVALFEGIANALYPPQAQAETHA